MVLVIKAISVNMNAILIDPYNSVVNIRWEWWNQDDHPYSSYMLQPYGTC